MTKPQPPQLELNLEEVLLITSSLGIVMGTIKNHQPSMEKMMVTMIEQAGSLDGLLMDVNKLVRKIKATYQQPGSPA